MKRPWSSLYSDDTSDDESLKKQAEEKSPTAAEKSSSADSSKSPSKPPPKSRVSPGSSASSPASPASPYAESEGLRSPAESHEADDLDSHDSHDSHGSPCSDSISQSSGTGSDSESDSQSPSSSSSSGNEPDPLPTSTAAITTTKQISSTSTSTVNPILAASHQTTCTTYIPPIDPGSQLRPPHGVTLYSERTSPISIPASINSYYQQRYTLFSRFDEGIWMTPHSWFEVTPENVGAKIAERVFTQNVGGSQAPKVVLDAFCGVGGNSIQFALSPHCERVFAIDNDPAAVWCARQNAELYGVLDKITFLVGDFFEFSRKYCDSEADGTEAGQAKFDIVFCSPPWGGPIYRTHQVFDVETMRPHTFGKVWETTMKILRAQRNSTAEARGSRDRVTALAVFYLPRTSNLNQLARYVGELGDKARAEAIHYCCNLRSKAVCLYVGGAEGVACTTSDRSGINVGVHSGGRKALQEADCNSVGDTALADRIQGNSQSTQKAKRRKRDNGGVC